MAILRFSFYFMIFFTFLLIPTSLQSQNRNNIALFIFGDSTFDAGNNNYVQNAGKANFWPYGKTFFKYPTGRFSDGRIIPDFIAEYLKLPFIQPYLQPGNNQFTDGVNFASGGAGALVETYAGYVIDLKTQLSYFKNVEKQLRIKLGDTETKALLSRAIYLFAVGSNDYLGAFFTNSTLLYNNSREEFVEMVIGNMTDVIKEIYEIGGRKFGILNLGTLGLIPSVRAEEPNISGEQVTDVIKKHNKQLPVTLKELQRQLKGFKYSHFDYYTSSMDRINNPSKYGLKEVEVACCGTGPYRYADCGKTGSGGVKEYELCEDPSEYLFFDGGHGTEEFYRQMAELLWSGSHKLTTPYNLKMLVEA